MKRKWQIFLSIVLYIIILAYALGFDIWKLVDIRLVLLVLLGTVMLSLPFYEKGLGWSEFTYIFGRKAVEAGIIQTFLLLFSCFQNIIEYEALLSDIAMCFRPLLYGFILLLLLTERGRQNIAEQQIVLEKESNEKHDNDTVKNTNIHEQKDELSSTQKSFENYGLTKREREIVCLIQAGKSNGDIASELFISETTVKKHVSNIFEKTGVKKREELICWEKL